MHHNVSLFLGPPAENAGSGSLLKICWMLSLQVHKAKLWTGETVAVKVQYPGLGASVTADLAVLTGLARAAEWLFPDGFRFEWILAELRQNLRTELDFRVEATNSERLRTAIGSHTSITVPAIVREVWQGSESPSPALLPAQASMPVQLCYMLTEICPRWCICHGAAAYIFGPACPCGKGLQFLCPVRWPSLPPACACAQFHPVLDLIVCHVKGLGSHDHPKDIPRH